MNYRDIVKPNFDIEYWLHYCRGLRGRRKEEYIKSLLSINNNNLRFRDSEEESDELANAIIELIEESVSEKDDILDYLLSYIFDDEEYINNV